MVEYRVTIVIEQKCLFYKYTAILVALFAFSPVKIVHAIFGNIIILMLAQ